MKLLRTLGLILALLATPAHAAGWVGAYVWGGVVTQSTGVQRFYDTVDLALASGFDTIRIAPGPSAIDGVSLASSCPGASDQLVCYARILFASSAWDDPGLKRIMLTAIDRTCTNAAPSNLGCVTASTLAANKTTIEQEYTDLFAYLAQRFAGRSVQFILSNWEGDNFVYCGDAYDYGKGGSVTTSCNASLSSNGQTGPQRVQALLQWFGYKDEAVAGFVAANPGFDLVHAPEFNNYNLFAGGCGGACNAAVMSSDSVLGQIKAAGGRQYCSYSSYDAQGGPGGTYLAAIRDILTVCQHLVIGEAGYDLLTQSTLTEARLYQALDQIRQVPGVLGVIPWNAVNPASGSQRYGLWDTTGQQQNLGILGPLRPTPRGVPSWR